MTRTREAESISSLPLSFCVRQNGLRNKLSRQMNPVIKAVDRP